MACGAGNSQLNLFEWLVEISSQSIYLAFYILLAIQGQYGEFIRG
jgi:hypothetical protein